MVYECAVEFLIAAKKNPLSATVPKITLGPCATLDKLTPCVCNLFAGILKAAIIMGENRGEIGYGVLIQMRTSPSQPTNPHETPFKTS